MRSFKKLGALGAVLALSAIGAANASAATFTASATGTLTGKATTTQTFTTNAGQVKCTTVETSGTIVSTASAEQEITDTYKNCTAFGFASVHTTQMTKLITADGTVHLLNTVTINVTGAGCTQTLKPQTFNWVTYTNSGTKRGIHYQFTGIHYVGSGGICGSGTFTNGTFVGSSEQERVGGGSISWDA
jgi:hypothetical protein